LFLSFFVKKKKTGETKDYNKKQKAKIISCFQAFVKKKKNG
jgi:hypothetical protein